jgi:protein SCO1/2
MVLKVDKAAGTMVVSHQKIEGYMDAMVMPFRVRDAAALDLLRPGLHVEFTLVVKKNESYAEQVRLPGGARFEKDSSFPAPAPSKEVALGQPVPDFELIDQERRPVRLSQFRGQVVAITFIYTRCPLPDVCPRLSHNFSKLQERFRPLLGRDLTLLSITFDPQFDRPEVLAQYARGFQADPLGWRFLTGPLDQIKDVCSLFGVDFWPDEGLITHSVRAAVLDRRLNLAANLAGRDYSVQQLGDLIETVLRN